MKKRYASDHPDDNPQATKRIKDHIPGMKTYKSHPGAKHQPSTGTYSKKGKMAALKKQHARRPEKYGITKESEMHDLMKKSADLRRQKRRQQQAAGAAVLQKKVDKGVAAVKKGVSSVKKKLGLGEQQLAEYKRRKIKDSGEEREHIIMQLRNAIDLKGRSKIQFATGRPQQIPLEHIRAALHVHDNIIKKSADKLRYTKAIEKSPQHLKRMTQGVLKGTPAMKTAKLKQSPKSCLLYTSPSPRDRG